MAKLISIFFPVRKGSKRVRNKNTRKIKHYDHGLLEIKVDHLKKLRKLFREKINNYEIEFVFSTNCEKTKNLFENNKSDNNYDPSYNK